MQASCTYIPYHSTGYFSKLVDDYIHARQSIVPFYKHPCSWQGLHDAIAERKRFANNRQLLVDELRHQYHGINLTELQQQYITDLLSDNTFTVCTAHQPNIFTGHLYFVYKILHTIKLASKLAVEFPGYKFVPVYYMGSEDADLEELGHINLNGQKLTWETNQTGAVGRMQVDKNFSALIERIAGEISVQPFGDKVIGLFKDAYQPGTTIQQATLKLVNELFKKYGLLTLIPDNGRLKSAFNNVVKRELLEQFSHKIVEQTAQKLGENYKVQAGGRELNLFYLVDGVRERIRKDDAGYWVSRFKWQENEILHELEEHPERFSPNVILRGLFQETILPNIAFIGGGAEVAYWLELKDVFEATRVPYPVLILRNSFVMVDKKQKQTTEKLGFTIEDLFKNERDLLNIMVAKRSKNKLSLHDEKSALKALYEKIGGNATAVDASLQEHVDALYKKAADKVEVLEKKMLRAEKRKFEAEQRQVAKLRSALFPNDSLQERVDNFAPWYAKYGEKWLDVLYQHSLSIEQQFALLELAAEAE